MKQYKILQMNVKDNVGMVLQSTPENEKATVILEGNERDKLLSKSLIDIYHKVALKDILKGDEIIKYGELIGIATEDIDKGMHVHVNNVRSVKV